LPAPIIIAAPAKINLYLHILGKRPDNYHLLESLVVFANVADSLQITPVEDFGLEIKGPFAGGVDIQNNSVRKAWELLQKYSGQPLGAKIILTKNLPVGAGIGGGSSDAAAALIGLNEMWDLNLPIEELQKIGLLIGADVPVCLVREASYITGIGEKIRKADMPPLYILLVNPLIYLSTAQIFSAGFKKFSAPATAGDFKSPAEVIEFLHATTNDLQENAIKTAPEIAEVLSLISEQTGCQISRMSGSGATCFGIFTDDAEMRMAALAISEKKKSWWVKPASFF